MLYKKIASKPQTFLIAPSNAYNYHIKRLLQCYRFYFIKQETIKSKEICTDRKNVTDFLYLVLHLAHKVTYLP